MNPKKLKEQGINEANYRLAEPDTKNYGLCRASSTRYTRSLKSGRGRCRKEADEVANTAGNNTLDLATLLVAHPNAVAGLCAVQGVNGAR